MKNLFYCGFVVLLAACQLGNTENQTSGTAISHADTLTYTYEDYVLYSKNIIKTSETTDTSYFKVSYPVFTDDRVNRFVLKTITGDDTLSIVQAAENFISEFDSFHESDEYPRIWMAETDLDVHTITPTYLCLVNEANAYTGGAHGNYHTLYVHYDIEHGDELNLGALIPDTYFNELTAIAERYFRKQEQLSATDDLDNYFFDDSRFSLPDNFALEQDSILFLYNIYEIKPYVEGQTELRLPYDEIERLLSDKAKRIILEVKSTPHIKKQDH